MIATVQHNLELIPGRRQVFVGQRAAANSGWSIWDVGRGRSGVCGNAVTPGARLRHRAKQVAPPAFEAKLLSYLPRLHELPELSRVDLVRQLRRPQRFCFDNVSQEGAPRLRPAGECRNNTANIGIRSLCCRHEGAEGLLRTTAAPVVYCRQFPLGKFSSPGVFGMNAGQPLAPIRQLQGDRNFVSVEIAVGPKNVWSYFGHQLVEVGSTPGWVGGCRAGACVVLSRSEER